MDGVTVPGGKMPPVHGITVFRFIIIQRLSAKVKRKPVDKTQKKPGFQRDARESGRK
jgi:hypothetical protein